MKNNKNAVLMAMALPSLPASAQVKIDSIAPHRYAAQSIDVGANVNFSREQSTSAVSVITSESTNKRSAKNIGNSILGQGSGPDFAAEFRQLCRHQSNLLHPRHAESGWQYPTFRGRWYRA